MCVFKSLYKCITQWLSHPFPEITLFSTQQAVSILITTFLPLFKHFFSCTTECLSHPFHEVTLFSAKQQEHAYNHLYFM